MSSRTFPLLATAILLFAAAVSAAARPSGAQMYIGTELGSARAGSLNSTLSGLNHPTRCDRLLYADPADAPTDAACTDNTVRALVENTFDGSAGFAGAANLGYAAGPVRIEAEFLQRRRPGGIMLVGGTTDPALLTKGSEWAADDPPSERISDFTSRQLFVNVFYAFSGGSRLTLFAGGGAGVTQTSVTYSNRWVRKTQLGDEDWQNSAEGTVSLLHAPVVDAALGYQVVAGIDYGLASDVSLTAKLRWAGVGSAVNEEGARWTVIRSHAPVHADGKTPFTSDMSFDGVSYSALTVGLRYSAGG